MKLRVGSKREKQINEPSLLGKDKEDESKKQLKKKLKRSNSKEDKSKKKEIQKQNKANKKADRQRILEKELAIATERDINQVNIDFNEYEQKNQQRRYLMISIKKWSIIISFCLLCLVVVFCAIWKTFNAKEMTGPEAAYYSNYYNQQTNFPSYGVETFLTNNINSFMDDQIAIDNKEGDVEYSDIAVDNIYKKTDELADVYFYTTIKYKKKETRGYFMMPVKWDEKKGVYKSGGTPVMTPLKSSSENAKIGDSPLMKFDGQTEIDPNKSREQRTFVDSFFKMLYSSEDIAPFYKGSAKLDVDKSQTYEEINNFSLYEKDNKAGYNAKANITLKLPSGVKYKTDKYIKIEKNGNSYTITALK